MQFKARFDGEAVNAGGVRKQVELKCVATFLRRGAQQRMGHHDSRFAVKFDDLFYGFWVPRTQMLDHSISVLIDVLRHSFSFTRFELLVPVQRALFPKIEVTDQQDSNVYHHFHKAV